MTTIDTITDAPRPRFPAATDDDKTYRRFAHHILNVSLGARQPGNLSLVDEDTRNEYRREGCAIAELLAAEPPSGPIHELADLFNETVRHITHDVYIETVRRHDAGIPLAITTIPSGERPPPWPGYEQARNKKDDLVWLLADIVNAIGSGNRQPDGTIEFASRDSYTSDGNRAIESLKSLTALDSLRPLNDTPETITAQFVSFIIWTAECVAYDTAVHTIHALSYPFTQTVR